MNEVIQSTSKNLLVWDPEGKEKVKINADLAFHFHQTHGFPKEMFEEEVNNLFKKSPTLKAYHISKAYDAYHNTNYAEKLEDLVS